MNNDIEEFTDVCRNCNSTCATCENPFRYIIFVIKNFLVV